MVDYVESPLEQIRAIYLKRTTTPPPPPPPPSPFICMSETIDSADQPVGPLGGGLPLGWPGWWCYIGLGVESYADFEGTWINPQACCPPYPRNTNFDWFNPVPYPALPTFYDPGFIPGNGASHVQISLDMTGTGSTTVTTQVWYKTNVAQLSWELYHQTSRTPDAIIEGPVLDFDATAFDPLDPGNNLGIALLISPMLPHIPPHMTITHTCQPNSITWADAPPGVPRPGPPPTSMLSGPLSPLRRAPRPIRRAPGRMRRPRWRPPRCGEFG
jgi:hypothetical protein